MDHDTGNKIVATVTFECQVCGFKSVFHHESIDEINESVSDWCSHFIQLKGTQLTIMACPACADLPQDKIFEGYQLRIRAGADFRFH